MKKMDIMDELINTLNPTRDELKAKDLELNLKTLNLKDRILLVTVPDSDYEAAAEMVSEAHDSLIEAGCVFSIVITPDMTLEAIDETEMNSHGWYRKTETSAVSS